ncbi:MAG: ABC transporter substrate-binding protein [Caldilineaceae bacterium]|nr:ABC transporter substrate-binding protein [Caldilineaceae bacterium]
MKYLHRSLLLFFCLGLLTACVVPAPAEQTPQANNPGEQRTSEPIAIKVGTLPYVSNTILQIAQEEGYFAEQGLAVEMVPAASANDFIPLLLQGELDIATPGLNAGFFNAVANGGTLKLALPLTNFAVQECTSTGFLARRSDVEAGLLATPAQWQGKKLTLSPGGAQSIAGYMVEQALQQGNLRLSDVALTTIDLPAQGEALRTGQTDIVYAIEPWITRMLADPELALLMPAEPLEPNLTASVITFGARPLAEPEIGRRFARAYMQAVRQYNEGKTERNVALVAAYTKFEPAFAAEICWAAVSPDGTFNVDSIQAYQSWLQEQGLLDQLLDPAEFIDTQFIEAANQALGATTP